MNILEIKNLKKSFGTKEVLKNVSFSIPEGKIFGFVGMNGAGKTTTMKIILGLLEADSGEVWVCGDKVSGNGEKTNHHIGYLPDVPEFYDFMNAKEYLAFVGEIAGYKGNIKERSEELLTLVGLVDSAKRRIKGYSRGMKQRLGIAQALFSKPALLICDEPTSALDPVGRKEILDLLVKAKQESTIIFSTHILSDVERIADEIAMLHMGEIKFAGAPGEIISRYGRGGYMIEFSSAEDADKAKAAFPGLKTAEDAQDVARTAEISEGEQMPEILGFLGREGIVPVKLEKKEADLESIFMKNL